MGLLAMLGAFVVVVTDLSELRAENFFTGNWDLGINQQMLWTTTHGSLLYESGDFEFFGVHSFLQVHSTYLAFLIAPIYEALPTPETLFALQTSVFAASAVPLFLIGKSVLRRRILLYVAILVYLTSFAVLSALFYDFHWEAFLPLEVFSFFLLVHRRRFVLSLVPLFAGTLTLEVFPFLAGGVVLFFLTERLSNGKWTWRRLLQDRDIRILAVLVIVAGASYATLKVLQYVVIPDFLGVAGSVTGASSALTSPFTFRATSTTLGHSALYWLLILGCLGFLPVLSPKHLIVSVPWFVESTFFAPLFSSQFGNQYALLAMAGVAVAFVHGLGKLESSALRSPDQAGIVLALVAEAVLLTVYAAFGDGSRTLLSGVVGALVWAAILSGPLVALALVWVGRRRGTRDSTADGRPQLKWMRRAHAPMLVGLLAVLVVFNSVMSPVNLNNFEATPFPGYSFQWGENPVARQMAWVTGYVPSNAIVLASNNLFQYVANNPNAYSDPWFVISPSSPVPYFPFTPTYLPKFILVDVSQFLFLPPFLQQDAFNPSVYGLVAYVYATGFPGTVYLFEEGYTQPAASRDVVTPTTNYYFSSANLSLGAEGRIAQSSTSKFGTTIVSTATPPGAGSEGIWYGPYVTLVPGTYRVVFNLTGVATNQSEPLAILDAGVYLPGFSVGNFTWSVVYPSELSSVGWTNLVHNITLGEPYPLIEFRGFLEFTNGVPNGMVTLNYIEVSVVP
jgi:uncharacterized membrane protein